MIEAFFFNTDCTQEAREAALAAKKSEHLKEEASAALEEAQKELKACQLVVDEASEAARLREQVGQRWACMRDRTAVTLHCCWCAAATTWCSFWYCWFGFYFLAWNLFFVCAWLAARLRSRFLRCADDHRTATHFSHVGMHRWAVCTHKVFCMADSSSCLSNSGSSCCKGGCT